MQAELPYLPRALRARAEVNTELATQGACIDQAQRKPRVFLGFFNILLKNTGKMANFEHLRVCQGKVSGKKTRYFLVF